MAGHRNACPIISADASLARGGGKSLERLCRTATSRPEGDGYIRTEPGIAGIERLSAFFRGQAFAPHRHDTYAIGVTLCGVQTFRFRGQLWHCRPGQLHILHPDETHDGMAGTDEGFSYRILYIDPSLIQDVLRGSPLPFVAHPVVNMPRIPAALRNSTAPIDDLARTEIVLSAADLLAHFAPIPVVQSASLELHGLKQVRDLIAACPGEQHRLDKLEQLCGLDRWTLARQFRAAFGTSPSRFRTMRQLDHLRRLLRHGRSLADAAHEAGFSDQSHMSRHFKRAYGITPGRWISAVI